MVTNTEPSITESPADTATDVMVPVVSASMLFCIFIASKTTTVSPLFTLSPTLTLTAVMVPGSGDLTEVPLPATGAAAGAATLGAAAGAAAGADLGALTLGRVMACAALIGCWSQVARHFFYLYVVINALNFILILIHNNTFFD